MNIERRIVERYARATGHADVLEGYQPETTGDEMLRDLDDAYGTLGGEYDLGFTIGMCAAADALLSVDVQDAAARMARRNSADHLLRMIGLSLEEWEDDP